jgi:hypothetical protein
MRREKDPDPDPYLELMDPEPGSLKTCGSGSPTLGYTQSERVQFRKEEAV